MTSYVDTIAGNGRRMAFYLGDFILCRDYGTHRRIFSYFQNDQDLRMTIEEISAFLDANIGKTEPFSSIPASDFGPPFLTYSPTDMYNVIGTGGFVVDDGADSIFRIYSTPDPGQTQALSLRMTYGDALAQFIPADYLDSAIQARTRDGNQRVAIDAYNWSTGVLELEPGVLRILAGTSPSSVVVRANYEDVVALIVSNGYDVTTVRTVDGLRFGYTDDAQIAGYLTETAPGVLTITRGDGNVSFRSSMLPWGFTFVGTNTSGQRIAFAPAENYGAGLVVEVQVGLIDVLFIYSGFVRVRMTLEELVASVGAMSIYRLADGRRVAVRDAAANYGTFSSIEDLGGGVTEMIMSAEPPVRLRFGMSYEEAVAAFTDI